jgi:hypothetical protein
VDFRVAAAVSAAVVPPAGGESLCRVSGITVKAKAFERFLRAASSSIFLDEVIGILL